MIPQCIAQYTSRILGPTEIVDYSNIVKSLYPVYAVYNEPFIGFKILVTDTLAHTTRPDIRIANIERNLSMISGLGCVIRETTNAKPNGYWIITLPVPLSEIMTALTNAFNVCAFLEHNFRFTRDGLYEVNVSGRCAPNETEACMSKFIVPPMYKSYLMPPDNGAFRVGKVERINNEYMVLRCRWDFRGSTITNVTVEDLKMLTHLSALIFNNKK